MRIIVYHDLHGCDTGCCGHVVELRDDDDDYKDGELHFDHPEVGDDPIAFAKRLLSKSFPKEHLADLDWDNCKIVTFEDC